MPEQGKTHEEILNRLNRRLRTLYQCNRTFFQAESEQELLQSICEILVAGGELGLAWIGYCEDDAEKTIRLVAQAGYGPDYLEWVKISWGEETEAGQGPFGIAVRTGKACWVDDIGTDPKFSPWRAVALAHGYASFLAIPLIAYGKPREKVDLRGTLNLYSTECNAFDQNAVEHYTGLATSLTYAVTALRSHLAEDLRYGVTTLRASDERKRTQEELRRSQAYLAEAQRLSLTGSFGWNVSTGEILWSEETFRIFQYEPTTKPTVELILQRVHPEDAARVQEALDRGVQSGTDLDFEHRFVMPGGSVKYVHVVAQAVKDETGNLEYIGAVMDITGRKQAEEALQKAQAELAHVTRVATLGEMTASIAHEINQPLAAVVNNASACLRWLAAPNLEEARQSATLIIADGHRASEIINGIRALTKKAPPQKAWVNINETILEVIALARSEVQKNRVSLRTQLSDDVPLILGDRIQLQQVILNLIINAIEAMGGVGEGPRELLVSSRKNDLQDVLVAVRDSGPGLDPSSLDHLFTAFFTTKPKGMGMGLAISRSIIEAHGGRLWAAANEGGGAVFQFTLPACSKGE